MQTVWNKLRPYSHDWLFLSLLTAIFVILGITLALHHLTGGSSPLPGVLVILFSASNVVFAFFALPRDVLLAYMFLATALVLVIILYFFLQSLSV